MARSSNMQARYDALVVEMKRLHGVRINKWRKSMSGCAWCVQYQDGTTSRLVESPYPRGPMSAAVFLHEIGHHAIGLKVYRPRCLEEYKAWEWSLATMAAHGFNVTPAVRKRMHDSLHYAIAKARRRGLKRLPPELEAFVRPAAEVPVVATTASKVLRRAATTVVRKKKARQRGFGDLMRQLWLWG